MESSYWTKASRNAKSMDVSDVAKSQATHWHGRSDAADLSELRDFLRCFSVPLPTETATTGRST